MSKVPTINPGPGDSDRMPQDATETLPIISVADARQPHASLDNATDISDEEAYAKLKAKRAERRRKKLIRRGIAAGVVVAIALIAIIATLVINAQPAGTNGPVTDMVTEGTFTTTVEAKGQLKPISASVVSRSVDGTVASINVQAGQAVNEGDVLMTIKNDELDRNVTEAQRAVAAAQEDLANAQKAAAAAQANPAIDATAGAAAGATSSDAADMSAISNAQRNLASAQATLDQANAKAAERTVTAPSSGKSTLMNILGCLDKPTAGDYYLQGLNVAELDDDELTEVRALSIGFVFQSFNLLPRLTVIENVMLPLSYTNVPRNQREIRAVHALQAVTLPVDHWDHRISELSGGQMQRVAIARALVNDPPIILADEPTGNLDSATGALVMETFHKLKERGKTIVLITHDPGIAAEADRAVTIRDGRIHDGAYIAHAPNTLREAVNNLPTISTSPDQPKGAKE